MSILLKTSEAFDFHFKCLGIVSFYFNNSKITHGINIRIVTELLGIEFSSLMKK